MGDLIGFDHVGLGSDFDGIFDVRRGLEDVSKFPDLIAEMLKAGISDGDAEKVIGGNILRVWANVETIAEFPAAGWHGSCRRRNALIEETRRKVSFLVSC